MDPFEGKDRREHLRTRVTLQLDYRIVERDVAVSGEAPPFPVDEGFNLLGELHLLSLEAADLARGGDDLLANLARRVDVLTHIVAARELGADADTVDANLCEGGIAFACRDQIGAGTCLGLRLAFPPGVSG